MKEALFGVNAKAKDNWSGYLQLLQIEDAAACKYSE